MFPLLFTTNVCQALTEVATMVARALYKQAGGEDAQMANIKADPQIVRLLSLIKNLIPCNYM